LGGRGVFEFYTRIWTLFYRGLDIGNISLLEGGEYQLMSFGRKNMKRGEDKKGRK
jgi:hypothetical protein